jgi:hypothetical protein
MTSEQRYYVLEALSACYPGGLFATALTRYVKRVAPETRHADVLACVAYCRDKGYIAVPDANAGDPVCRLTSEGVDFFTTLQIPE